MTTVAEHFAIAELLGGVWTPGHFYDWRNDPVGHDGHLHAAFSPRQLPDAATANPPTASRLTDRAEAFKAAVFAKFPDATYLGGIVRKHRNNDPAEPWSQHTFGNAIDVGGDHALQDAVAAWINGPWEDDVTQEDFDKMLRQAIGFGADRDLEQVGDVTVAMVGVGDGARPSGAARAKIYDGVTNAKLPPGSTFSGTVTPDAP